MVYGVQGGEGGNGHFQSGSVATITDYFVRYNSFAPYPGSPRPMFKIIVGIKPIVRS